MKKWWKWFCTGVWPPQPPDPSPDANKVMTCDLCADPDIQVGCRTHKLILCGHCTTFHNDHSQKCTLYLLEAPTLWERKAHAQRYDAV